ncbi:D-alanyl-D-alanine carboxypeptidase/D-alanyl-D-alanine-endopeptidase [Aeromonas cavernicola]|uniref:D-alanyl-D-alanine carboxypeptidase/D-alanyl-D-alanine-endopeptidase n=1 Tax=Aeromonas cavernicola TaxID=1006623 RepID=A0A2H9U7I5_9GAMM|nr:D-alanyl-D-alanine carboxypeptidase/D-alanyl-D-alanine-endopeptidase [Aeromonas cavernicola]PJG59974.1 D-alanyl-D-alanine carboxypeptidase/D-alanyl-D-alanine-endopeptidase [Aeromonas cavernicola]
MQRLLISGYLIVSSLVSPLAHATPLTPPKGGQYAIMVQGNNGVEFARHADQMIAPASTMKVLTALAARLELGADFRFATDIQAQPGAKQGDTINGDIWINFVGDPTLSRMDLLSLFKQLGVSQIKGNVYVNTGAYNGYERGNGWSWGDQTLCFAAPVSSVIIDNNCAYATLSAPQIGKPATGNVATGVPIGIGADNVEVMSYGDMARQFCALEVDMAKGNFYELKGCITPSKEPHGLRFAIHDVEAWGWDNIRWAMDRAGIQHDGLLRVTHTLPQGPATLATHQSAPLPVMLAKMLKKSDNLYADTFLKTVGRHYYNKPGSYRSGTMAVRAILTKQGIKLDNAILADGSGLSAHNLISARQMMAVLDYIQKNDAELGFIKLLPSAQVDGTLAWRRSVTAPMMKNRVHAKTGTITGTSNLAGFIDTASGERKAFVVLQRGLAQDPAAQERDRASKAVRPWMLFEKGVLERIYQNQPIEIQQE